MSAFNLAGPTGLEPATSGVTGQWSRVFRESSIYTEWDNSLKPRGAGAGAREGGGTLVAALG